MNSLKVCFSFTCHSKQLPSFRVVPQSAKVASGLRKVARLFGGSQWERHVASSDPAAVAIRRIDWPGSSIAHTGPPEAPHYLPATSLAASSPRRCRTTTCLRRPTIPPHWMLSSDSFSIHVRCSIYAIKRGNLVLEVVGWTSPVRPSLSPDLMGRAIVQLRRRSFLVV